MIVQIELAIIVFEINDLDDFFFKWCEELNNQPGDRHSSYIVCFYSDRTQCVINFCQGFSEFIQ